MNSSGAMSANIRYAWFIAFCILYALLAAHFLTDGILGWGGDSAQYLMQARSLVDNDIPRFIEFNEFTITKSSYVVGPSQYPWGYPLILSAIYELFGFNLLYFKVTSIFIYLLFIATLFFGLLERYQLAKVLILTFIFAINPFMVGFADFLLSDLAFLLLSTAAILLMDSIVVRGRIITTSSLDRVILGCLLACACSIRLNGIALIGTLLLIQAINFRNGCSASSTSSFKMEFFLNAQIPYVTFFILITSINHYFPSDDIAHKGVLSGLTPQSILESFIYNIRLPAAFFGGSPWIYIIALIPFSYGLYKGWRSELCFCVYCVLTFALYTIWPGKQGLRFLFPILPFFILFLLDGLSKIRDIIFIRFKGKNLKIIAGSFYLIILISFGFALFYGYSRLIYERSNTDGPFTQSSDEFFAFIRSGTSTASIVVFRDPRAMTLLTNRKSLLINDPQQLFIGNYIALDIQKNDEHSQISINRLKESGFAKEPPVFENNQFKVYELKNSLNREGITP